MPLGPTHHEVSRRLAETRDEDELTAFMALAARVYNTARLDGTAASAAAARKAKERLRAGMLAMMYRLRISPHEYDANGQPQYGRNKLCQELLKVRVATDSGGTVGLDEVEAWDIARKHLCKLHEALVEEGLKDESIFDRNLAPMVNRWYRRGKKSKKTWDTETNAVKEAERCIRKRLAASLEDLAQVPESAYLSPEESVAWKDEREALTRAARELPPMQRLVFLLGFDLDDLTRFRIPPKEISDLVTPVVRGECDSVEGASRVVEEFNDGRHETIGPETLRIAMRVIMIMLDEQPELKERSWEVENVRRIAGEVKEQLAAVIRHRRES